MDDEGFRRFVVARRGSLLRTAWLLTGDLDTAEEAFQDACLRALKTWPQNGPPRDPAAWLIFVGRNDDVFKSSDYRISPFELESVLIEHPAVAEVGVIGKPDPERTEIVKAFIVLKAGYTGSPELTAELQQHVRHRLAAHAFPREIAYLAELPKTPSGKIQRFVLRQME